MIPSSPRRTWLFLGITLLLYYAPDLLTPASWQQATSYAIGSAAYQGLLVVLWFAFGPAICRAMVVREISAGGGRNRVDQALATIADRGCRPPPMVLVEQVMPFVLTAGLLPRRCQTFVSTALVDRLSSSGLNFLLARAALHAQWPQRSAALLPLLVFTILIPDDPRGLASWLEIICFLAFWLVLHWASELHADWKTGQLLGAAAVDGLRSVQAAQASPLAWLTPQAPIRWRLRVLGAQAINLARGDG